MTAIVVTQLGKAYKQYPGRWARLAEWLVPFSKLRHALKSTRPAEKPHAHQKFWQDLLGQTGGHVRPPLLSLTEAERHATQTAFETCGLRLR